MLMLIYYWINVEQTILMFNLFDMSAPLLRTSLGVSRAQTLESHYSHARYLRESFYAKLICICTFVLPRNNM